MARKTLSVIAAAAPFSWRRKSRDPRTDYGDPEGEWGHRPLLHLDISAAASSSRSASEPTQTQRLYYGATQAHGCAESSSLKSPDTLRRDNLLNIPEEHGGPMELDEDEQNSEGSEEEALEYELEERGLYQGSYAQLLCFYALVPLSSLIALGFFVFLLVFAYPPQVPDPYPRPKFFPSPLPEILTSVSLWSLSHFLRIPLYSLFCFLTPSPTLTIILSTTFHVLLHNLLRLAALPLLLLHHQPPTCRGPAFHRVWWIALGWSFAEVVVAVSQGYEQIALYRDVLVPLGRDEEFLRDWPDWTRRKLDLTEEHTLLAQDVSTHVGLPESEPSDEVPDNAMQFRLDNAIRLQVDHDLDHLMALKGREEVEEVYGIPVIRIPVFISCLQRLDSIILSLGLTLLLSAAFLRSPISSPSLHQLHNNTIPVISSNRSFYVTFTVVVILHLFLSFLHTPLLLPKIGVHTAAYAGLLVGLGCFFAGLGMWEVLS